MSDISTSDVKKLAILSALTLSDEEETRMLQEITEILSYVEQLQSVDTEGVEPTYQVHPLETVTRPDTLIDYQVSQEALLKNAPKHRDGSVVVPKVLG